MTSWESPAKLNLYLAVTGIRKSDGFHELDSLVTMLDFGDTLQVSPSETEEDAFDCNAPGLTWSPQNLVYKAVECYRDHTGFRIPLKIRLEKRIPLGAGLGGGSSNASTMLKALNSLNPNPVTTEALLTLSAELGSDCPMFFRSGVIHMQGRGERVSELSGPIAEFFDGKSVLVFHPGFGVSAAWTYRQLKFGFPNGYTDPDTAEQELQKWKREPENWNRFWRNDLQPVVEKKYLALSQLIKTVMSQENVPVMMSGSGSACFCILEDATARQRISACVRNCWGEHAFVRSCKIQFR